MKKSGKLARKLIIAFVVTAILGCWTGILQTILSTDIERKYEAALTDYGFAQGYVGRAMIDLINNRTYLLDMLSTQNDDELNTVIDQFDAARAEHDSYAKLADATVTLDAEKAILTELKNTVETYYAAQDKYIDLIKSTAPTLRTSLRDEVLAEIDPLYNHLYDVHNQLMAQKVNDGNEMAKELKNLSNIGLWAGIGTIAAVLAIAIVLGIKIAQSIGTPVGQLVNAAKKIENGDLDIELTIKSKDEIGVLGRSFGDMSKAFHLLIDDINYLLSEMSNSNFDIISQRPEAYVGDFHSILEHMKEIKKNVSSTLSEINEASSQVAAGSEQVSSGAQSLAQGATEQASSIEELSATITEISSQVKVNAEHATKANEIVNQVRSEIEISNQHMGDMTAAMSQINESSSQIGKIINTIEDIAFQTNILALNAAVEAARAGAAGKGFAVVADEVRNLASKSAEAVKNTTALIENSMNQVGNGSKIAEETATSLTRVVESAKMVADTVNKISNASSQQADAIGQVTLGVEQISSVVQTNSATAEECAAASEELSGQAQTMKTLVGEFKLANQANQDLTTQSESEQEDF